MKQNFLLIILWVAQYDQIKMILCKKNNVFLIVVPYTLKNREMRKKHIVKLCQKNGIDIQSKPINKSTIDYYMNLKTSSNY